MLLPPAGGLFMPFMGGEYMLLPPAGGLFMPFMGGEYMLLPPNEFIGAPPW
jgi:hypothetical protein